MSIGSNVLFLVSNVGEGPSGPYQSPNEGKTKKKDKGIMSK